MSNVKKVILLASVCLGIISLIIISPRLGGAAFDSGGVGLVDVTCATPAGSSFLIASRFTGLYQLDRATQMLEGRNEGIDTLSALRHHVFTQIVVSPSSSDTIFAVADKGYVLKSTNHGTSWAIVGSIPGAQIIYSLALDPTDSRQLFAGSDRGLYYSSSGGEFWERVIEGPWCYQVRSVAFGPAGSQSLYATATYFDQDLQARLYSSHDGGATWSFSALPCPTDKVVADPSDGQVVYALDSWMGSSAGSCPLISIDGGTQFREMPSLPLDILVRDIAVRGDGTPYIGTSSGIYHYDATSERWINEGLLDREIYSLTIENSTLVYVTAAGVSWRPLS